MTVYDSNHIKAVSRKLARSIISIGDFEQSTECAKDGDLVFLDPPYTVTHDTNGFLKYNKTLFSWEDQERLARVANKLRQRGCFVIVSNAAHSCIAPLYPAFDRKLVSRHSTLAAASASRKSVSECLYMGYRLEQNRVAKICSGDRQDTHPNEP
jgi:DNA adenine methylase